MAESGRLTPALATAVLDHLRVPAGKPSLRRLDALVAAYVRRVPWESVSRIVRRAETVVAADCPRWPRQFWQEALAQGTGGTCFESNYAFWALLQHLGYDAYLTINNMSETIGCHTAIVVDLGGEKWVADAGYPLYAPLPLRPHAVTYRRSPFMHYAVRPLAPGIYNIEQRPHPVKPVAFTLIDSPVTEHDYRAATAADYGASGLFLDRVLVNKVIDGCPWRFDGGERPWRLNRFWWGKREDVVIDEETAARHFGLSPGLLQQALKMVGASANQR